MKRTTHVQDEKITIGDIYGMKNVSTRQQNACLLILYVLPTEFYLITNLILTTNSNVKP